MVDKVIRRSIAFENIDVAVIKEVVNAKGLGSRGFSAALRMIIREWVELKNGSSQEAAFQDVDDVLSV